MRRTIKKYLLIAQILTSIVVALLFSIGTNALLASTISSAVPFPKIDAGAKEESKAQLSKRKKAAKKAQKKSLEIALSQTPAENRNLFNYLAAEADDEGTSSGSANAGEVADAGLDGEPEVNPEDLISPGDPIPTDLPINLMGTHVASDQRWSRALLKATNEEGKEVTIHGFIGRKLLDDATIIGIARNNVYFTRHSRDNRVEFISIDADPAKALKKNASALSKAPVTPKASKEKPKKSSKAPSPRSSKPKGLANFDPSRITQNGNEFNIPNDMAQAIRNNKKLLKDKSLGKLPKATAYYRKGKVAGFRLRDVEEGSLWSSLGIQNSDILLSVNGRVIDKPQVAASLFDSLSPGEGVKVKIKRGGKIKTITYNLSD